MYNKVFLIDFNKFVIIVLPTFLRKLKLVAFLQCLILPVKILYADFIRFRSGNLYNISKNGQVCYLRSVLNDVFDPTQRRIKITDGSSYKRQYIYTNGEQQPKYLGKIYLRQNSDYADTGVDFKVILPIGYPLDSVIHQMKATIEFYKLASKRFKIQYENE